jgi:hypothetical protein
VSSARERIEALFAAGVQYWKATASFGRELDSVLGSALRAESIIAYLDERRDLERRRASLHLALALIADCDAERANRYLLRAGLTARLQVGRQRPAYPFHDDYPDRVTDEVLAEAEREGLL